MVGGSSALEGSTPVSGVPSVGSVVIGVLQWEDCNVWGGCDGISTHQFERTSSMDARCVA